MNMINIDWLINIKDWITIHLGKNPKNGGIPPSDNKLIEKINFKIFEFIKIEYNWFK